MDFMLAMTVQDLASVITVCGTVAGCTLAISNAISSASDKNAESIDALKLEVNDKLGQQYLATQDLASQVGQCRNEICELRGGVAEVKGSIDLLTESNKLHADRLDNHEHRLQKVEDGR